MKFLKKASLAASIAAVSFAANAELVAMDEMSMAAATGQAGIDIDITLEGTNAISIEDILYTDTDTGGGISIDNLTLGKADGTDLVLTNAIDVTADGDITIATGDVAGLLIHVDGVYTVDSNGDNAANLVGNTDIVLNMTASTTVITQNAGSTVISNTVANGGTPGTVTIVSADIELLNGAITLGGVTSTAMSTAHTLTFDSTGVAISDLDLNGDITIADVKLGTDSIGSLQLTNLALNNASIKISGH